MRAVKGVVFVGFFLVLSVPRGDWVDLRAP